MYFLNIFFYGFTVNVTNSVTNNLLLLMRTNFPSLTSKDYQKIKYKSNIKNCIRTEIIEIILSADETSKRKKVFTE